LDSRSSAAATDFHKISAGASAVLLIIFFFWAIWLALFIQIIQ
jgi:hypothetical protein